MVIFDTGVCIVVVYGVHASKKVIMQPSPSMWPAEVANILLIKFSIFRHFTLFLQLFGVNLNV